MYYVYLLRSKIKQDQLKYSMENFEENKIFGDVFCGHLKARFDWNYKAINPQDVYIPSDYPDIDIVLNSGAQKNLYLQLKQPIEFEKREHLMTKSWIKIFKKPSLSIEDFVAKVERKYIDQGKNINNVILTLHKGLWTGYSIPEDTFSINKDNFSKSAFRGIYFVSRKLQLYDPNEKTQDEFVFEIKDAFKTPPDRDASNGQLE